MSRRREPTIAATDPVTAPGAAPGPGPMRGLAIGLVAAAVLVAIIGDPDQSLARNVAATLIVVPFAVWAWRPPIGTVPLVVPVIALVLFATSSGDLEAVMFALSTAAVLAGLYEGSRRALVAAGAMLVAAPVVKWLLFFDDFSTIFWVLGVVLPLLVTVAARHQDELRLQLADARAELADQRLADERRRIARDVHDSVGHGLAAMLLHLTAARHVLRRHAGNDVVAEADASLAEAEAAGKGSLDELRRTLGLLRGGDRPGEAGGPAPPVPDAATLAELGIEVVGDLDRLDPLVGRSLHRVAEEALANARKYATGATAAARLEIGERRAVLTVANPVCPADGTSRDCVDDDPNRPRYGIVGMSERMAAVGGTLDVGPIADGWLVRAAAPVAAFPGQAGRRDDARSDRPDARHEDRTERDA